MHIRAAALGLAAVLLVTGCSNPADRDTASDPTSSPTAEDSRFAIPVPGVPPAAVPGPTVRQAQRFGRYFLVEQVGYLVNAGFQIHYRRSTHFSCEVCRDFSAKVETWHAKGPVTMDPIKADVIESATVQADTPGLYFLAYRTKVPPVLRAGEIVQSGFAGEQRLAVYAYRGHWKVARWDRS